VRAGRLVVTPDQPFGQLALQRDRLQVVALDVVQVARPVELLHDVPEPPRRR
jgi:hypothetical protein